MSRSNVVRLLVSRPLSRHFLLPKRVALSVQRTFIASADMNADIAAAAVAQDQTTDAVWSSKMVAWQVHSYGTLDDLVLTSNARSPVVIGPKEVLVRVTASSVNPLDVLMTGKICPPFRFNGFNIVYFQRVTVRCCWVEFVKHNKNLYTNP